MQKELSQYSRKKNKDMDTTMNNGDKMGRSQARQYLACAIANVLSFMAGTSYSWMTPMLPVLQSNDSPFDIPPVSDMDASWLASINNMTRILSIFVFNYTLQHLGHKVTGLLIAALFFVVWIMFFFANSVSMLFWARFITGLAIGGVMLLVPSYTIDIAEDNIKGRLGVLFALSMNLGCTFVFIMGFYTSFTVFHVTNILVPIIFIVAFFWMPESPLFLAVEEKTEEAKEALLLLRNGEANESEIERLQLRAQNVLEKRKQKIHFRSLTERGTWKAVIICLGLTINQQCCGLQPITVYTLTIFHQSGTIIPANIATILIGILLTVGSILSSLTTEKYGRRNLLLISNIGMIVCLTVLGAYLYLGGKGWDLNNASWVPFLSLSLFILSNGVGILPLTFTLITEMVSPQARSIVQSMCLISSSLASFFVALAFLATVKMLGLYGCFWLYALVCIVSAVCIFLTVPETKNRSIEDVVKQLKRDDYVRSVLHGNVTTPEDVKLQSPE